MLYTGLFLLRGQCNMAGDRLVKVVQSNQHESTNQLRGRDMAGDLITIVASRRLTQLTINNQTQGSLARTEDLRSVKSRALPDVPLSLITESRVCRTSDSGIESR